MTGNEDARLVQRAKYNGQDEPKPALLHKLMDREPA